MTKEFIEAYNKYIISKRDFFKIKHDFDPNQYELIKKIDNKIDKYDYQISNLTENYYFNQTSSANAKLCLVPQQKVVTNFA